MQKTWIGRIMLFACCLLMCTSITYAVSDDTDGSELQVAQPVVLEIQLGQQWAGTEFQLKTDTGLYPGTITVGQDGILRTELGSSGRYILSCANTDTAVLPPTDDSLPVGQDVTPDDTTQAETQNHRNGTVGGIPIMHIVLFCGGLLLALGALLTMHIVSRRRSSSDTFLDGEEEDEY
jgi:hypothetical protein